MSLRETEPRHHVKSGKGCCVRQRTSRLSARQPMGRVPAAQLVLIFVRNKATSNILHDDVVNLTPHVTRAIGRHEIRQSI